MEQQKQDSVVIGTAKFEIVGLMVSLETPETIRRAILDQMSVASTDTLLYIVTECMLLTCNPAQWVEHPDRMKLTQVTWLLLFLQAAVAVQPELIIVEKAYHSDIEKEFARLFNNRLFAFSTFEELYLKALATPC